MKALTKKDLIHTVAKRWKKQYRGDVSSSQILTELMALSSPTEQQITDVIGNQSWTANVCTECERSVKVVVLFGYEPVFDSWMCKLCRECLQKALRLAVLHSGTITTLSGIQIED